MESFSLLDQKDLSHGLHQLPRTFPRSQLLKWRRREHWPRLKLLLQEESFRYPEDQVIERLWEFFHQVFEIYLDLSEIQPLLEVHILLHRILQHL